MNRAQLARIRHDVEDLARSPKGRKAREFIRIAQRLGRQPVKRGKEPTWIRRDEPAFTFPLSIPNHPGDMKPGTARSITETFFDDLDVWEQFLDQQDARGNPEKHDV
jgi:hypothetical protein